MSILGTLDLLIGLSFVYVLMSLIGSGFLELVWKWTSLRSRKLEEWVLINFKKGKLGKKILDHPLIDSLSPKGKRPDFIPENLFAESLLDEVWKEYRENVDAGPESDGLSNFYNTDQICKAIGKSELLPSEMKSVFAQYLKESEGKLEEGRKRIAEWFDQSLGHLSQLFAEKSRTYLLAFNLLVAVVLNVDSIEISKYLYHNPVAASQLADAVAQLEEKGQLLKQVEHNKQMMMLIEVNDTTSFSNDLGIDSLVALTRNEIDTIREYISTLETHGLPIGWPRHEGSREIIKPKGAQWINKLLGWTITVLAVSMGAPFWYDLLRNLLGVRKVVKK